MDVHPTKNVSIGIDPYPFHDKEMVRSPHTLGTDIPFQFRFGGVVSYDVTLGAFDTCGWDGMGWGGINHVEVTFTIEVGIGPYNCCINIHL